jgi:hypothetical protein
VEHSRFDAVVRGWSGGTRRGLVRLLGGTAAGALLLGRLGMEEAAARCVKPDRKCKKNGKKQKCCGGAKCKGKRCRCLGGRFGCGKNCCVPGQLCENGGCVNGPIPIGDACTEDQPGACTSGVCGCNFGTCTCRDADCVGLGEACADDASCCLGACGGGTCFAP